MAIYELFGPFQSLMRIQAFSRAVLALLILSSASWGREFRAMAGEPVAPSRWLVRLKPGAAPGRVFAKVGGARVRSLRGMNLHVIETLSGAPDALASNPEVEYIEPDRIRHSTVASPNDPGFSAHQWGLQTVEALRAWSLLPGRYLSGTAAGAPRLKVAVLDSGVDCTHPDFKNAGAASNDAAAGGQIDFADSRAPTPTTIATPACSWQDDYGHGTHVAGIIAAATNNGAGVAGLGYPVQVMVYKVLDNQGKGLDSVIAEAIMGAANSGAAVISMSLGSFGYSQTLQDAVTYAWQHNAVVVAAAGNNASSALFFPAAANHVVGVAAIDNTGNRASFSNHGDYVDVAAPGVNIYSTVPTYPVTQGVQNYAFYYGTSMAAPFVSALGGLVAMATPGLAADGVAARIEQSAASSASGGGWDESLGYGVIDSWRALSGNLRPASVGGIVGQVVDASNLPVAGAVVRLGFASVTTDYTGLFRIANQPADTYALTVSAPGYSDWSLPVPVLAGADTPVTVPLGRPLGLLSGAVSADGGPLAGAIVQAASSGLVQGAAMTDAAGHYWLPVPEGTYDVRVSAASFVPASVAAQAVPAGGSAAVDVALDRMGWVAGSVRHADGTPVANAEVDIDSNVFSAGATTDASGNYTSVGLPAGAYTVTASPGAGAPLAAGPIAVPAGGATRVDLGAGRFAPIRVDCGGASEIGYSGGYGYATSQPVAGANGSPVYQTERWGSFAYRFAVPNGAYKVTLQLAEIYFDRPGQRVFSVAINGQTVLSHFDIVAQAGGSLIALDRQFTVAVTNGAIEIRTIAEVQNPKLSGIVIE
jgi:thermitase